MKVAIEYGKLTIDVEELASHLSPENFKNLAQLVVFKQELFEAVVDTLVTGQCFEGWWVGGMAEELQVKLLPLLPDVVRELVEDLSGQRDRAIAQEKNLRSILFDLERRWPPKVSQEPIDRYGYGPHFPKPWNKAQAESYLSEKLGPEWEKFKADSKALEPTS